MWPLLLIDTWRRLLYFRFLFTDLYETDGPKKKILRKEWIEMIVLLKSIFRESVVRGLWCLCNTDLDSRLQDNEMQQRQWCALKLCHLYYVGSLRTFSRKRKWTLYLFNQRLNVQWSWKAKFWCVSTLTTEARTWRFSKLLLKGFFLTNSNMPNISKKNNSCMRDIILFPLCVWNF